MTLLVFVSVSRPFSDNTKSEEEEVIDVDFLLETLKETNDAGVATALPNCISSVKQFPNFIMFFLFR